MTAVKKQEVLFIIFSFYFLKLPMGTQIPYIFSSTVERESTSLMSWTSMDSKSPAIDIYLFGLQVIPVASRSGLDPYKFQFAVQIQSRTAYTASWALNVSRQLRAGEPAEPQCRLKSSYSFGSGLLHRGETPEIHFPLNISQVCSLQVFLDPALKLGS